VILVAAAHTGELGLGGTIVFRYVATARTRLAGVMRWNRKQHAGYPQLNKTMLISAKCLRNVGEKQLPLVGYLREVKGAEGEINIQFAA